MIINNIIYFLLDYYFKIKRKVIETVDNHIDINEIIYIIYKSHDISMIYITVVR